MQHQRFIILFSFLLFSFLSFGQSGNVGIGVDTPQTTLHVSGTTLTDSLKIPTGAKDGYIFTADSLGNGFWTPLISSLDPTRVDAFQFNGPQPEYIDIQGNYAYVSCDPFDSLLVFDLSNPALPERIGGVNIQFPSTNQGLVVNGNYAYTDYGARLFVYDISDPTNPFETDHLFLNFDDLAYNDGYIYTVGNFFNALHTINVQNPDSVFIVDTLGIGGDPNGIAIDDNKAYIVDAGSLDLKIFDLANPEEPSLIGSVIFGQFPTFVEAMDGFVYATDNLKDSLFIINATDPTQPVVASTVGGFSIQNGLKIDGNTLYMSDSGKDSLYILDVSNPYAPAILGTISIPNTPTRMDVRGDYIYQLNENPDRIEVFRVSQNLVTADMNGETQVFDGQLPGLLTISSNDQMDHLRLNRIGVGGVHLTATNPVGLMITTDDGNNLMSVDAASGNVAIGNTNPVYELDIFDDNLARFRLRDTNTTLLLSAGQAQATIGTTTLLRFFTDNAARMAINASGNIGIGTDFPEYPLHIENDGFNDSAPTIDLVLESSIGLRPTILFSKAEQSISLASGMSLEYDGSIGSDKFYINGIGGIPRLTVESAGQVGIGTQEPAALLEVSKEDNASIRVTSTNNVTAGIDLIRSSSGNTDWRIENGGNLKLFSGSNIDASATEEYSFSTGIFRPAIDLGKQLGASTTRWTEGFFADFIQVSDAGVTARIRTDASAAVVGATTNHGLDLITNNTSRMHIDAAGEVGIGTTAPEHPLHIQKNGTSGVPTISLVMASASSKRPTILFSENSSSLDLNDGMSLEYDGAVSGNKFYVNGVGGTPRLTVESSGDVGIGTTNPTEKLEVSDAGNVILKVVSTNNTTAAIDLERASASNTDWRIQNSGNLGFFSALNIDSSPTEYYTFSIGSFRPAIDNALDCGTPSRRWDDVYATNGTIQTSDMRLKKEINPLQYGLDEVLKLNPVSFLWNDKPTSDIHLGLIAQEVQKVIPEVVHDENPERLGMNYPELVPVLINAVKELKTENDQLKAELDEIKSLINLEKVKTANTHSKSFIHQKTNRQ